MKRQLQICQRCGHEQVVERYSTDSEIEEARRRSVPLSPPQCGKCGSPSVVFRD